MARRRVHAAEFIKLLESASRPLYVVDDSLTIVYLNEACRAWLGEAADALPGQTCVYDSGDKKSAAERLAAGLCPPPAVLEGREVTAALAYDSGGQTLYRSARFVPLNWAGEPALCILALVDAYDSLQADMEAAAPEADESQALHLQLQRLRQRRNARIVAASVVGVSPAARRAAAQTEVAAATRANVLLVGPPGSGRRRLAEAIHYAGISGRKGDSPVFSGGASMADATKRPAKTGIVPLLVPLECGLLDADLILSTLRAAAGHSRSGSAAGDGGTLLLCDADRLPHEAQAAVVAALSPPGSPWRAIATAAAPLIDLAPRGRFREDLAAMLSTITIELPPLSQRRGDVPLLAQALLEEQNARGGKQLGGFAPDALDRLCAYPWPGEIAELAQVVAESHTRAAGTQVTRADLPERLHVVAEAAARPRRKEEPIQLDEFIARIERELVRRALARSKGNKAKAARLLGLNRPRLYRRMVQLGLIEREES
jgi:DNA-binding NtrC family response regulator